MESVKVSDYMHHRPVAFRAEMSVVEAVEKLLQTKQLGGPVVDTSNVVIGYLSEQDCLKQMLDASYQNESHTTVNDVMNTNTVTIKPYSSIVDLAQKMMVQQPKVYPVVDDDHKLVGLITRGDVLKALDINLHSVYQKGSRFL